MKKISYTLILVLTISCTSNTIFEKPKDLIPRDTMSLLIQELHIAVSAKYQKNTGLETNINYIPLVYEKFKIDSTRFKNSNLYYASVIDVYREIIDDASKSLEKQKKQLENLKRKKDSIKNDSLRKSDIPVEKTDTLKAIEKF